MKARVRAGALVLVVAWAMMAAAAYGAPVAVRPTTATPMQFAQATQCVCHPNLLLEWQQSMHSQALTDKLFLEKVAEADDLTNGKMGPFCRRCHAPVANMTGQDGRADLTPAAGQGVVCSFCHQTVAESTPLGDVSHLLLPDSTMRAQYKDAQSPHFTAYSKLHTTSRLCGGCHELRHPGTGVALLSTYAEWTKSPAAKQGLQCQDCHMSESPPAVGPSTGFAAETGPQRTNLYHMNFAGAQVGLGNPARARALLQKAATIELDAPEILSGQTKPTVRITVRNVGAGHYIPTGVTEFRQMWLSIVVVDDGGTETEIGRRMFGTEFKDAKGHHPAETAVAAGVAKDDRIPPGGAITQTAALRLPPGVEAADVTARLLYRSAPEEFAKKLGVENPTTVMAEATKRVYATPEAKSNQGSSGTQSTTPSARRGPQLLYGCAGLAVLAAIATFAFLRWARKNDTGSYEED